jgi:hypothetical protein
MPSTSSGTAGRGLPRPSIRACKIGGSRLHHRLKRWTASVAAAMALVAPAGAQVPDCYPEDLSHFWWRDAERNSVFGDAPQPKPGERFTYSCPPIASMPANSVWGSGPYREESSVCWAAVHGGLITPETGGSVTIVIAELQSSFEGTTQNGVESESSVGGAGFYLVSADKWTPPPRAFPNPYDASEKLVPIAGGNGTQCSYGCPPGVPLSLVWGTGIYTDRSRICSAAIHAGVISHESGGWVTIIIAEGQSAYAGSTQNGVSSSDHGIWDRSFTFEGASATAAVVTDVAFVAVAGGELDHLAYESPFRIRVTFSAAPQGPYPVDLVTGEGTQPVMVSQEGADPRVFYSGPLMLTSLPEE